LTFFTTTNGEDRIRVDVLLSFGVDVRTRSYIEKVLELAFREAVEVASELGRKEVDEGLGQWS